MMSNQIDQDDDELSALQAVISPKSLGAFKDDAKDQAYWEVSYQLLITRQRSIKHSNAVSRMPTFQIAM